MTAAAHRDNIISAHYRRQARLDKVTAVLAELDYCALVVGTPRLAGKSGVEFFVNMSVGQVRALYQAAGVRPGSETTFNLIIEAIRSRT